MANPASLLTCGISSQNLEDPQQSAKLISRLGPSQRSSFDLLAEWTKARQANRNIDQDAKAAEGHVSHAHVTLTYHDVLARLKHYEFPRRGYIRLRRNRLKTPRLDSLRRQAAYYAACERIATSCWAPVPLTANALLTLSQPLHGASIVPEIGLGGKAPHYLWDSQLGKTREVEEINLTEGPFPNDVPDYVAISHSWVRWQDASAPWLELPGVPWRVPQNRKFKVEALPQRLSAQPWRYFWIDLLTIPQGSTLDADLLQRQDWEIKCVPQTFRKALKAFVWLDDVPSWTSLPTALAYLSLQYLSASPRAGIDKDKMSSLLRTASTTADNPLELLDHDQSRREPATNIWEPNGWFTSPWSLQEMIVRPDMLLCNGNWEFLEITKGIPVALNDIAVFLRVSSEIGTTGFKPPLSVKELHQLFERTGMKYLLDITPDTSVQLLEQVEGISPARDRGFPCIVQFATVANPHITPTKDGPKLSEYGEPL